MINEYFSFGGSSLEKSGVQFTIDKEKEILTNFMLVKKVVGKKDELEKIGSESEIREHVAGIKLMLKTKHNIQNPKFNF